MSVFIIYVSIFFFCNIDTFFNSVHINTASRRNLAAGISWPPSSYFEISINIKACIILEWYIIIRFMISITLNPVQPHIYLLDTFQ